MPEVPVAGSGGDHSLFLADSQWVEHSAPNIAHPNAIVTAVSFLSDDDVARMQRTDLLDVLRMAEEAAGEPVGAVPNENVTDETLRRLVLLLRRRLRNQVNGP